MAESIFTKRGVSRTSQQGVSPITGGGFGYDPSKDVDLPSTDQMKKDVDEYLGLIETAYNDLLAKGRAESANSLRVLGDRLKRIANTKGVSSEQIARQMSDTTNQLNAQTGLFESKVIADKLNKVSEGMSKRAGIFHQDMQKAQFRENVLRNMEDGTGSPIISDSKSVKSSQQSPIRPVAQVRQPMRQSPLGSQDPAFRQTMQDAQAKQNIASFLNQREMGLQNTNPLYRPSGPAATGAQAGMAVTQANMGVTPGLFKSSASGYSGAGRSPIAAQPAMQGGETISGGGYTAPGPYVPSATSPIAEASPVSTQPFIYRGPASGALGKYAKDPKTGRMVLSAKG